MIHFHIPNRYRSIYRFLWWFYFYCWKLKKKPWIKAVKLFWLPFHVCEMRFLIRKYHNPLGSATKFSFTMDRYQPIMRIFSHFSIPDHYKSFTAQLIKYFIRIYFKYSNKMIPSRLLWESTMISFIDIINLNDLSTYSDSSRQFRGRSQTECSFVLFAKCMAFGPFSRNERGVRLWGIRLLKGVLFSLCRCAVVSALLLILSASLFEVILAYEIAYM